jgi:DNA repair exonuclease SbcCD ATPase subunit
MKIISLTLTRNVKIMLRHISYVAYQPNREVQLILGTNGSGKSTLLWELSPLPADKDHYETDGSKVVEVEHNGELYRLSSWFEPTTKHSFVRVSDKEELNPGNTLTVQKELCEKLFNYTSAVHLVLLGKDRFTNMQPKARREWITRLSPTSYDYALKAYRSVQEEVSYHQKALKNVRLQLVEKEAQVTSIETQKKLEQEIEQMHADLQIMIELRKPVEEDSQSIDRKLVDGRARLRMIATQLLCMKIEHPYSLYGEAEDSIKVRNDWGELENVKFTSTGQVTDYIQALKVQMAQVQTRIDEASRNHQKLKKTAEVLEQTGLKSRESMQKEITGFREAQTKHRDQCKYRDGEIHYTNLDPRQAQSALDSVQPYLIQLLADFPENQDKRFSKAVKESLVAVRLELKTKIGEKQKVLHQINAQISHHHDHSNTKLISCPECRHQWIPGNSLQLISELKTRSETEEKEIKELEEKFADNEGKIVELEAYFAKYRQYVDLTKSSSILYPLWLYIADNNLLINQPKRVLSVLSAFESDLQQLREVQLLEEQIFETEKLIAAAAGVGDANLATTLAELKEVESLIEAHTQTLTQYRVWLNRYEAYRKGLAEAENLGQQVQILQTQLSAWQDDAIETLRREMLNHAIRQFQVSMNAKEASLASITAKRTEINQLTSQIQVHEESVQTFKAMREVLSPTDGLIAQGLMGFVQSLIEEMNLTISTIWTYPMSIQDCRSMVDESAELDYAFPLQVNYQPRPVPDIREASNGQKEVIDLAFKLVLMKYYNLDILYLDEFGAAMDAAHQHAAAFTITKLTQDYGFGQLFIASHNTHIHGALQADVNVMDSANISTPEVYNEYLELQ